MIFPPIKADPQGRRLAIILESPSVEEKQNNKPLVNGTGLLLKAVLAQLGLPVELCLVVYIKPNVSKSFHPESYDVHDGFRKCKVALAKHDINCCLLVGEAVTKLFGESRTLTKMHGSVWQSFEASNIKCVATYRPSAIMRNYTWITPFKIDINRAIEQSKSPKLHRVERKFATMPTFNYITTQLNEIITNKTPISFDLEGYPNQVGVTCYSVATSPRDCFIVPFRDMGHQPVWSLEEEMELWRLTSLLLSDPDISKTAQNELINVVTIFLGLGVGSKLQADKFLNLETLGILALGAVAFSIGTAAGVLMAKLLNKFSKEDINPLIGAAGVSAVPMAARVVNKVGLDANPQNFLLMHAMGPNVAGVLGSAVAAGIVLELVG